VDLGGKIVSFSNQRTCVYTVASLRGKGVGGLGFFPHGVKSQNCSRFVP
jgi:hypothetical protein